ncbi:MAG: hypothetical protein KGL53_04310, partial [Elusimicrobia bacterium]|nr:hypothetical protein [Elusimicrobiota bacterium]
MSAAAGNRAPLLLAAFMAVSGVLAGFVLLRGSGGGASAAPRKAAAADSVWPEKREARLHDPSFETESSDARSSLEMAPKIPGAGGTAAEGAAGGAPSSSAAPAAGAADGEKGGGTGDAGAGDPENLSAAERAQLANLSGTDLLKPGNAARVAQSNPLWYALGKALAHYPKLLGFVANNETVVKAFMSRPKFSAT